MPESSLIPVLPVPMVIASLLAAVLLQRIARGEPQVWLTALVGLCALQSAIIALVQYYDVSALRPAQPVFAMAIPPVAWLAFVDVASNDRSRLVWWHGIGPAMALVSLVLQPELLDFIIPVSFAGYGLAILVKLAGGEDSLPNSLLASGARAVLAWRIVGLSLLASALCDAILAWRFAQGTGGVPMWLPSLVSSLSLLSLGALSLTSAIESRRNQEPEARRQDPDAKERDRMILDRLEALVAAQKPHLDPELTLSRLARKLVVPAKHLSEAINRGTSENVSRYINRLRVEEACRLLATGLPVTIAMLESGFNTKSNFNREFLRVTGKSPSQWLSEQGGKT
jgi:AraC-like DNA-binding protein